LLLLDVELHPLCCLSNAYTHGTTVLLAIDFVMVLKSFLPELSMIAGVDFYWPVTVADTWLAVSEQ